VTPEDARSIIEGGVRASGGTWADLGAGEGTFTRALAQILGAKAIVYAVERDQESLRMLRQLEQTADPTRARIIPVDADFTRELTLPALDGILAANSLHFVPRDRQGSLLARLARDLEPGAQLLIVEYERERGSPWVPYPISRSRLRRVARDAGLAEPTFIASAPSAFGGEIYSATVGRIA
jgi:SAM-dependent methyltransferase